MISGPPIEIKCEFVSDAIALASKVFPVPGGPYSNTPLGGCIPNLSKISGCRRGNSIISLIFLIESPKPPMSSYETFIIRLVSVGVSISFLAVFGSTIVKEVLGVKITGPIGSDLTTAR